MRNDKGISMKWQVGDYFIKQYQNATGCIAIGQIEALNKSKRYLCRILYYNGKEHNDFMMEISFKMRKPISKIQKIKKSEIKTYRNMIHL